jgi:hypothetical protein
MPELSAEVHEEREDLQGSVVLLQHLSVRIPSPGRPKSKAPGIDHPENRSRRIAGCGGRGPRMKLKPGRLHVLSGKLTFKPTKSTLGNIAQSLFSTAQQNAFNQGVSDFEHSTRDHPPYGFSDLKQAWKAGWLAASQRAAGKRKCAG